MIKNVTYFIFLCFISSQAQKIDQFVSYRNISSENYFRFHYDNDYFAASDENYTQGYSFEFVTPFFRKNPLNVLLIKPKDFNLKYGLAIEHIGFTPDRYDLPDIQFQDRPFAAAIMAKSYVIGENLKKKWRVYSSFSLGIIGPRAFGEEMQVGIHKATGNKTPRGWRHQIKNDAVVNYFLGLDKQILSVRNLASIQLHSSLNVGTLFTNVSVGANIIIGKFDTMFSSDKAKSKFEVYTYFQPKITAVAYDATLQGGLLNKTSPYTIRSEDIERLTEQYNLGIIVKTKTMYFEYTRSIISKELNTGSIAKWGGIRIGFTF